MNYIPSPCLYPIAILFFCLLNQELAGAFTAIAPLGLGVLDSKLLRLRAPLERRSLPSVQRACVTEFENCDSSRGFNRLSISSSNDLESLQNVLGVKFNDISLLQHALVHRSAVDNCLRSNQRLEFLGDAILDMVVSEYLYHSFPDLKEGELTARRKEVVNSRVLAKIAKQDCIGDWIVMTALEASAGGRTKESILADAAESIIAAVYLDQGMDAASTFILRWLGDVIQDASSNPEGTDFKSRLQELMMQQNFGAPQYTTVERGVAKSALPITKGY